jgi:MFS superfamily sulfate permease-like transporter
MVDWGYLYALWRGDPTGLAVVLLIACTAVTIDPSAGIVLGVAIEQLLRTAREEDALF